ncbi:RNA-directed DNA polymerase, eukaryota, reverse transcriptase zinc-binding domain protein [Tanacetum coccineum]
MWGGGGGVWDWRYLPRRRALDELSSLVFCIGNTSLSSTGSNKWFWTYDTSGLFKVKSLAKIIQNLTIKNSHVLGVHHKWNSWIPKKVNVCVCTASFSLNHLATHANLMQRGINISDVACLFCGTEDEDVNHVLISRSRVLLVLRKVWSWWNLDPPVSFQSSSLLVMWPVGIWRNRVVNAPLDKVDKFKEEDVFPSIQCLSQLWISSRISTKKMAD